MKPCAEQGGSFDLQRHYVSEPPTRGPIGGRAWMPSQLGVFLMLKFRLNRPTAQPDTFSSRLPSTGRISRWRGEAPLQPLHSRAPFSVPSRAGRWRPLAGTWETMGTRKLCTAKLGRRSHPRDQGGGCCLKLKAGSGVAAVAAAIDSGCKRSISPHSWVIFHHPQQWGRFVKSVSRVS